MESIYKDYLSISDWAFSSKKHSVISGGVDPVRVISAVVWSQARSQDKGARGSEPITLSLTTSAYSCLVYSRYAENKHMEIYGNNIEKYCIIVYNP